MNFKWNYIKKSFSFEQKISYVFLFILIIFATALRVYQIDFQSLWNDELSSIMRSEFDKVSLVLKDWDEYGHPPGLYLLYYYWIKLFSNSEISIRIPSIIAGVSSVIFIYLLAKKIYSKKEGIISASFMTILWCPIYFSQEARQYSLLILFSIIVSYLLIVIINRLKINNFSNKKYYILYILSSIFISYLHYFGLLLVAIQAFYMLILFISKKRKNVHVIFLYLIIFLAYIPWISTLIFYSNYDAVPHIPKPSFIDTVYFFEFLFNWSEPLTKVVFFILLYFFIKTSYDFIKNKSFKNFTELITQPEIILGLWLFIPFIIVYIRSIVSTPILTYRSLLISLPAAYILLSRALIKLPSFFKINYIIVISLLSLFTYDLFYNLNYYTKPTKDQFRESVKYIIDNNSKYPDSKILAYTWNTQYFNYYFKHFNSELRTGENIGIAHDTVTLNKLISNNSPKYIWYVYIHRNPEIDFITYLDNNFHLIEFKNFIGGQVRLYEKE